jgi:hypothetical protein
LSPGFVKARISRLIAGTMPGEKMNFPVMPEADPVHYGFKYGRGNIRVTEDFMLQPFTKGIHNKGRGSEIHIRHPHGDYIFSFEYFIPKIKLYTGSILPVDDFIKIIVHQVMD